MSAPIRCLVKDTASGDTLIIDSTKTETHTYNNTVTDHPVEEGANISDHVRPEPITVTMECFVSNTPLALRADRIQNATQRTVTLPDGRQVRTTSETAEDPTIKDVVYQQLLKWRNEGTPLRLTTTLTTYAATSTTGMILQNFTVPRTAENYNGIAWSMTLKEIRIVKNRSTRDAKAKDPRVKTKKRLGTVTPKPVDNKTALARMVDSNTAQEMASSDNPIVSAIGNAATTLSAGPQ